MGCRRRRWLLIWIQYPLIDNALKGCCVEHSPASGMLLPTPLHLTSTLLALLTLSLPIHSLSVFCSRNLYGRPQLSDVITLGNDLPYVKSDPDGNVRARRTFAEPAFFTPKFQGLINQWQMSMVQLPRVWRFRKFISRSRSLFDWGTSSRMFMIVNKIDGIDKVPPALLSYSTPTQPATSPPPSSQ